MSDGLRGRRSRRTDDGRRDERRKTDTTDTVSPLTALGRFGRLGAKRKGFQVWRGESGQSLNSSASADTLLTEGFLEAGGSSDCLKKDWRKPAAVLLRLAILFGLSAIIRETVLPLHINIHQSINLDITSPKVLSLPTDLERVSP